MANVEPGGVAAEDKAPSSVERAAPRFDVPPFARSHLLADLPLKPETRRAVKRAGWCTLGDVHHVPLLTIGREGQKLGLEAVADLASIIALVRLGRLVVDRRSGSDSLDGLLGAVDDALDRLDVRDREVLLLRLGAGDAPALTHRETARRCGLGTHHAAQNRVVYALKRLRRIAGPEFAQTLRDLEGVEPPREPIADLLKRQLGAHEEGKHGLAFYARLLWKLVPGLRG